MRIKLIVAFALLIAAAYLSGQEAPSSALVPESPPIPEANGQNDEDVFAPFPMNLRVGARGPEIVISWADSPDVSWGYRIYRSSFVPDQTNYSRALLLGEVAVGVGRFVYQVPDDKPYYYFVLAKTADNAVYEVFIPLKNVSLAPISADVQESPVIAAAPASETARPAITRLSAQKLNDSIVIQWTAENEKGRTIVYRSAEKISNSMSLIESVVVSILEQGVEKYTDYPIPGIAYYYAAIPEIELISGSVSFAPGKNTTTEAILIPAGVYRTGLPSSLSLSRTVPLPYLVLTKGISEARPLDTLNPDFSSTPLTAETEKSIRMLLQNAGTKSEAVQPTISILPDDLKATGSGEDYTLKQVVQTYFANGKYKETIDQLNLYLSLPRSKETSARAHFYRGQALVKTEQWREAFFEFLQAQESYYIQCSSWITYVLDALHGLE